MMTEQQIRKKLSPKKPSRVVKQSSSSIPFIRRDYGLTTHQKSWVDSLTASLSGWRSRQAFLKAQIEAHLKFEREREALEAAQQAALQAEEDEWRAGLQAEAAVEPDRKAAGCEERASESHQAGTKNIDKNELNEEVEDEDERNDESTGGECIVSSNIQSPPTTQPASIVPPAAKPDWRIKAQNGITKKKLTIDKGWSAFTWNQKSNVRERLLLLEVDGYDITDLRERKASSEEITAIILARAAAQNMPALSPAAPTGPETPEIGSVPTISQEIATGVLSASPALSNGHPPLIDAQPAMENVLRPTQNIEPAAIEEIVQPFSHDEPYRPQASRPLKRKRDSTPAMSTIIAGEAKDLDDETFPARKKRNVTLQTEEELQTQALQEIKLKTLRRIFRPTRSICRAFSPPSRINFHTDAMSDDREERNTPTSTLDYLYGKHTAPKSAIAPLHIKLAGYNNIMAEMRFLTDTNNPSIITDPDLDTAEVDTPIKPVSRIEAMKLQIKKNMQEQQRQRNRISISTDEHGRVVLQGDTLTLAGLCRVLQDHALLYCVEWEWDELQLRPSNDLRWSLSPQMQDTLLEIARRLEESAGQGRGEVCVAVDGEQGDRS